MPSHAPRAGTPGPADLVVVGAGIVGAACAYHASRAGLSVTVVDSGPITGGTTGAGEGNILVSDKEPGPELDLALYSNQQWRSMADLPVDGTTFGRLVELETKGGLVVAADQASLDGLARLATQQRDLGIEAAAVPGDRLREFEPHLTDDVAGGYRYPQDLQVQPMLAAAHLLRLARRSGATVLPHEPVTGVLRVGERVVGVRTPRRDIPAAAVLNAAGTWAGKIATLAGVPLPIAPRRGYILVTEPLPPVIRHKVYLADYVADVASDSADLQSSTVVEGTRAGTVLIGATRERVGLDRSISVPALRQLAAGAVRLFPFLRDVAVIRAYRGFRPYCPDHLPVIGADPRAPGLHHACGHEGAGIGLSLGTARLITQGLIGEPPEIDLSPFRPDRFGPEVPR
ncbi:NAD(P)/FAD-dependent oxidoreductase [Micromonospora craniellae]|uniref:FAD-binding oxidoreductase n=1 Tax=Micromonospora craniellae TaxID=2294034 RepID=A0A372G465_9ACTN|nr:FAD-binding oxidoreductase [Micromonospora craniellae]QOC92015.1 FAD-binding oxidoreductase [Micromonospora craniellae]RFS47520.1 FAD-binding oxidoreductase [Micromonospora craniellae]